MKIISKVFKAAIVVIVASVVFMNYPGTGSPCCCQERGTHERQEGRDGCHQEQDHCGTGPKTCGCSHFTPVFVLFENSAALYVSKEKVKLPDRRGHNYISMQDIFHPPRS